MKKHIVNLFFNWDEGNEGGLYEVETPDNVTDFDLRVDIEEAHDFLCEEDEECRYENNGRDPETLLEYLSEKNGWDWNSLEPDIEIELE